MKVLLLGPTPQKLLPCMQNLDSEILISNQRIDLTYMREKKIDFLVSYNYRYLISRDILDFLDYRAFNLHASFLPFNRGAHPVLWSILENTPFGISIHRIDEGLDTGPIFIQKRLEIVNDQQSIRTIYDYANQELVKLFCTTWAILRSGQYSLLEQKGCGTYHKSVQSKPFMELLDKSWDSSVTEARLLYSNYLKSKSE